MVKSLIPLVNLHFSVLVISNVLKIRLDRSFRPVRPSIGHKTGLIQCKKQFLIESVVEPASSHNFYIFFFKLKRCRFDVFYIETMFYLELESL